MPNTARLSGWILLWLQVTFVRQFGWHSSFNRAEKIIQGGGGSPASIKQMHRANDFKSLTFG
jgi:hypothetical protein